MPGADGGDRPCIWPQHALMPLDMSELLAWNTALTGAAPAGADNRWSPGSQLVEEREEGHEWGERYVGMGWCVLSQAVGWRGLG